MSHHYICFSNVSYRYPDGTIALDNVSFRIDHGEKVAILGLNGSGKTTLLLHTNGLLLPTSGEVNVGDVPLCAKTLPIVRRAVGLVFQNADNQLFMPTVEADVAFGPTNMGLPPAEVERRVDMALQAVGCATSRHKSPAALSGGLKKCVAIATVLSMEPDILVLDEPTTGLDILARRKVEEIITSFNHTCLIATHDLALASKTATRALLIENGRLVADSDIDSVIRLYTSRY